ncbi:type IV pilus modification PilV family protein [Rickettsiella endosymbiont of Dermanyssus gallinae]|uniref:type IV pilus modification PilV family protein n=1 Tax=Rickettsiella endosymbiont of Dermanyssus gallinae TaxID=2856608 RepID=UPI001C52B6AF|nr:prepilin-type N-terminal cleavage/methylation domain-containing protein [Rickettsiella endosymbiont of Dermanyssus gallinae]
MLISKNKKAQQGFSLIEVMLSLFILSIGLLSFTQSQLMALRASEQAYFINLADLKNNELAERVYSCSDQACIQAQLILVEEHIANVFPEGEARLTKQSNNYQYKISWRSLYYHPEFKHALSLLFRL